MAVVCRFAMATEWMRVKGHGGKTLSIVMEVKRYAFIHKLDQTSCLRHDLVLLRNHQPEEDESGCEATFEGMESKI